MVVVLQSAPDDEVVAVTLSGRRQGGQRHGCGRRGRAARAAAQECARPEGAGGEGDEDAGAALAAAQGCAAVGAVAVRGREVELRQLTRALQGADEAVGRPAGGSGVLAEGDREVVTPVSFRGCLMRYSGRVILRRGVALQVARQLDRAGSGVADDGQQHLDDQRGVEIDAAGHVVQAVRALARGDGAVSGEVDEDGVQGLAPDERVAQGGEQEGPDGDMQEGAELLVGPAGLRLADGAGQGAVAGEAVGADREQAEAVEAQRVAEGVEAAIAVVAAQVVDLAEVAEGGSAVGSVEGLLELGEGERLRSGESIGEEGGGAPGHARVVCRYVRYTVPFQVPDRSEAGRERSGIGSAGRGNGTV